jgi:hypothetical protein
MKLPTVMEVGYSDLLAILTSKKTLDIRSNELSHVSPNNWEHFDKIYGNNSVYNIS